MKAFKQITGVAAAVLMAAGMMTSCSGGGNTPAKDGPLGSIPSIYKVAGDKGYEKATELFSATSREEAGKIMDEVKAIKDQMEKDVTEAFEAMKGKEIPTVVSEEVPMKLTTPLTLTEMKSAEYGKFKMEADVEMTADVSFYKKDTTFPYQMIRAVLVDADGKGLYLIGMPSLNLDKEAESKTGVYPAGTKGHLTLSVRIEEWNAEPFANMDKICFLEFEKGIYEQAKEISDSLKEIDRERTKELYKNVKIEIK